MFNTNLNPKSASWIKRKKYEQFAEILENQTQFKTQDNFETY